MESVQIQKSENEDLQELKEIDSVSVVMTATMKSTTTTAATTTHKIKDSLSVASATTIPITATVTTIQEVNGIATATTAISKQSSNIDSLKVPPLPPTATMQECNKIDRLSVPTTTTTTTTTTQELNKIDCLSVPTTTTTTTTTTQVLNKIDSLSVAGTATMTQELNEIDSLSVTKAAATASSKIQELLKIDSVTTAATITSNIPENKNEVDLNITPLKLFSLLSTGNHCLPTISPTKTTGQRLSIISPTDHVYSKSPDCAENISLKIDSLKPYPSSNKRKHISPAATYTDQNSMNLLVKTKTSVDKDAKIHKKKRKRSKFYSDHGEFEKISKSDEDYTPSFAKKVKTEIYPPLTQRQINLLLIFFNDPETYYHDNQFLSRLMSNQEVKLPSYLFPRQLQLWHKMLSKRKIHGMDILCLKASKKLILPKEKYDVIIEEAHLGTGSFIWSTVSRDDKGRAIHNSYNQTLKLIETDYGVGYREFGMSKYQIYKYIANCSECSIEIKKLPALSKVLPAANASVISIDDAGPNSVYPDPDALNESKYIDMSDAPLTMLWPPAPTGSIWHDQIGLAAEKNQYSKLLGVINELGFELGETAQGNTVAKERFITKLYCADRLIKEEKDRLVNADMNLNSGNFLQDYFELQKRYVNIGKLDLFLYDVNLLAVKYNLTKNDQFMKMVNTCVKQFNPKDNQSIHTRNISIKPLSPLITSSAGFVSLSDVLSMKLTDQKAPSTSSVDSITSPKPVHIAPKCFALNKSIITNLKGVVKKHFLNNEEK